MNRLLKKFCVLFLLLFCFNYINVQAETAEPQINAQGCALIDAASGTVLWGKNENCTFEPASTTKVMTALLVLENCSLDEEVTVQQDFTSIDGTAIGLLKGDVLTVHDLLLGLLMESGNDCANALACHVSGSIEEFAKLMNAKAKELGATSTNFKNPSGLNDPEHVTTPHDLALFMREAINNKDFIDISTTPTATITLINNPEKTIILNNKNYMINKHSKYYYKYALCGKNGYTTTANHTYVDAAEKDGHVIIATFLNATDKNQNFFDMHTVLDYGFNNFSFVKLYSKGDKVTDYKITNNLSVPLIATKDIGYAVPKGQEDSVDAEFKVNDEDLSKESFEKGDNILDGTLYVNDKEYETAPLSAGDSRTYETPLSSISNSDNMPIYIAAAIGCIALLTGAGVLLRIKLKK